MEARVLLTGLFYFRVPMGPINVGKGGEGSRVTIFGEVRL